MNRVTLQRLGATIRALAGRGKKYKKCCGATVALTLSGFLNFLKAFEPNRPQTGRAKDFSFYSNMDFAQTLRGWTPRWTPNPKNLDTEMDTMPLSY